MSCHFCKNIKNILMNLTVPQLALYSPEFVELRISF